MLASKTFRKARISIFKIIPNGLMLMDSGTCRVLPVRTTLSSEDWKGIGVKRSEMDSKFGW